MAFFLVEPTVFIEFAYITNRCRHPPRRSSKDNRRQPSPFPERDPSPLSKFVDAAEAVLLYKGLDLKINWCRGRPWRETLGRSTSIFPGPTAACDFLGVGRRSLLDVLVPIFTSPVLVLTCGPPSYPWSQIASAFLIPPKLWSQRMSRPFQPGNFAPVLSTLQILHALINLLGDLPVCLNRLRRGRCQLIGAVLFFGIVYDLWRPQMPMSLPGGLPAT